MDTLEYDNSRVQANLRSRRVELEIGFSGLQ